MAVRTPINAMASRELAKPFQGDRHEIQTFAVITDTDTYTMAGSPTPGTKVRQFAWRNNTAGETAAVSLVAATGVFTFAGAAATGGTLHLWFKG